ncbi:MAG: hypothetical protein ACQEUN_17325 [Pseudomonadota bacterium]
MKVIIRFVSTAIFAFSLTGCASVSMLPQNASEVNFDTTEGKTGWSKYEQVETFQGYSLDQVYSAAKVGIGSAGFSLRLADKSKRIVLGEHGMTMHDWNVIAGVYLRERPDATQAKVIIEGSKDIGFSGDVTSDGWSGKILREMRRYLNATYPKP